MNIHAWISPYVLAALLKLKTVQPLGQFRLRVVVRVVSMIEGEVDIGDLYILQ